MAEGIAVSNNSQETGLNNNDLIIGPSGCGKTGSYVVPNLQNPEGSIVVSDTKGQLYRLMKNPLEKKGYKVCCLDLVNPQNSCGYNPLSAIRKHQNGKVFEQDILTLANTIVPELDKHEPFWSLAAAGYVAFLVAYCLEALEPKLHNLISVCCLHDMFIRPNGDLAFAEFAEAHPDSFTARKYNKISSIRNVEKTWNCIAEFSNRALEPFDFNEAEAIFCGENSFDISSLGKDKIALFINTSDTDRTFDNIANLFYTQTLQLLCAQADKNKTGRLDVPVRLIMDDFASGAKIPDFDKIISVIRSRDISVSIIIQSLSQLESLYSHAEAMTIINNCDHILFMGSRDVETSEFIAYHLGRMPETVLGLPRDKMILITSGEQGRIVDKIKPYCTLK